MQDRPALPSSSLVASAVLFYGAMTLAAVVAVAWSGGSSALVPPPLPVVARAFVVGALAGLAVALLSRPLARLPSWKPLFTGFRRLLGHQSMGACLVVALTSGGAEEALFRGVLQPWVGLWPAALLFAMVHAPGLVAPSDDEIAASFRRWPLFAFVVGAGFGLLTVATGTWLAAATAHGMVNYLNLRYICGNEAHDAGSRPEDPSGIS